MNELIELGLVGGEAKAHDNSELVELGLVVSETKAHCHGVNWDGICMTTAATG